MLGAIAAAFEVPNERVKALRARLKHLKNLGMVRDNPGTGRRVEYSFADIVAHALALELTSLGLWARDVVPLVQRADMNDVASKTLKEIGRGRHVLTTVRTFGTLDAPDPRIELDVRGRAKPEIEQLHVDPGVRFSVFDFGDRVRRLVEWLSDRRDEPFESFVAQLQREIGEARGAG
jgi:hypothetical protein